MIREFLIIAIYKVYPLIEKKLVQMTYLLIAPNKVLKYVANTYFCASKRGKI